MKKLHYYIVAFLLLTTIAIGLFSFSRTSYEVQVNLSPEERVRYEAIVSDMDAKIKSVNPGEKPDIDYFIEKARYQEYLGQYGKAIDTLLASFRVYDNTSVGWNNVAKLYEKVGDYKKANAFYKKLIETFRLDRYYLDMAWNFYRMNELGKAYETFGRYTQLTGGKDDELFKLILEKKKS